MSSTLDVNVLLYSSNESSPFHAKAIDLIGGLAEGPEILYLFWPVLMGYLRMVTHSAIFPKPLSAEAATKNVEQLLALPHARAPGEGEDFWAMYKTASSGMVVAANLVPDAHIVALMRENGVGTLWSHDRDFRKFEGIRVRDPFV